MRVSEERSDELRRSIFDESVRSADTSTRNVAAANSAAISNATNTTPLRLASLVVAAGKVYIVIMTGYTYNNAQKLAAGKGFLSRVKRVASFLAAEPEEVDILKSDSQTEIMRDESGMYIKSKKKHAYSMLAIRWHAEVVAEKACIIAACLCAVSYFGSGADTDSMVQMSEVELAQAGTILFGMEIIADTFTVFILNKFLNVPMLSAIPHLSPLSTTAINDSLLLAFAFTAQGRCIYMASLVEM